MHPTLDIKEANKEYDRINEDKPSKDNNKYHTNRL
jgi:hypothetical protein